LNFFICFLFELSKLFSQIILTIVKSSLNFLELYFRINLLKKLLFKSDHFIQTAPINYILLHLLILGLKSNDFSVGFLLLVIHHLFDEICGFFDVSFSFFLKLSELLFVAGDFIKCSFSAEFNFFDSFV